MLIVATKISESFVMADPEMKVEDDLEDGEIESDEEDTSHAQIEDKKEDITTGIGEKHVEEVLPPQDVYYSKSGKKKKSKSKEQKYKDKSKKNRKYVNTVEDDFAGNIEKAIRKAMNKDDCGDINNEEEGEERRKHKKRRKYDSKDGPSKKRKKQDFTDEMDESEMMCVRGASPVQRESPIDMYADDDKDSYGSDSSNDSRGHQHHRPQRHRPPQRDRNKNNKNERRRQNAHPMQDPDGVCLYYMQGKCHKGDDCIYSHDAQPPRKMELCKFYLMDCCAKRDKCLYMHADFPCGNMNATNVLSIKNLSGVLTPRQISDLTKMGIDNLDQLGQLTVLQLNSIGISLKQITEIQLNTMSIQKLGLINTNNMEQQPSFITSTTGTKDLDLRVAPPVTINSNINISAELPGRDVDMRFQPSVSLPVSEESSVNSITRKDSLPNKDLIDIDQYTKDALKYATKDKENIDISNETFENDKSLVSTETKDVDHRVLPFSDESTKMAQPVIEDSLEKKGYDTDIRFLRPDPIFKSPDKRHRRSTTDDEDNNLLIDEKWYSSDEEKCYKRKSPASSPQSASSSSPAPAPHVIEPSTILSRLGDLSKIDISEEVTKLLHTMKNNLHDNKPEHNFDGSETSRLRDPRSKKSPEKSVDTTKTANKKLPRISIYECIDGEPTDGRRRTDVDLRKTDFPAFGDTDLRQGASGDIDFRLGLPFKAIPNYTPASEIDGSINSHPPIPYKLVPIHIPRPDYTDIRNSTAKSQALVDPRLRKVFRLSLDESNSDSEKSTKPAAPAGPRVDPRRKQSDTLESSNQEKSNSLDIQTILQNSNWFKGLSSTQKILINQHLMPVTQMVKQYQQEKSAGKNTTLDLTAVQSNTAICGIFTNLGITLSENGDYTYLPKPKEALLKTPINFNQPANPYAVNTGGMDPSNMNMMNMQSMGIGGVGGMNNMNVGHMSGYNQPMADPRTGPTPGLLGIAPNIPHNFNNFPPNNYGNMGYNGPNNYNMDGDQNYPRFPHRGGHRGRGNDRWNRGSSGRGHRDRKNFNERGNWKNDRH
ncbi:protein suppressor of sable isoform X3 [Hyposmocoma kahamanoa]|uniref:protein suppressor of sable isoform X3 n=1 Tax=Hyposmocoma kahamanoa TaxID=1477025 RepID=UPI000E6D8361|nr:protein suppressor of sable isoform X3 [Hyposmocoma kahamanoa]